MTKTLKIGIAALAAFLALSGPARAAGPEDAGDHDAKMEEHFDKVSKKLGLSADQKAKLEEDRKAHRDETKALRDQLVEKHKALKEELEKSDYSEEKVRSLHDELKSAESKLADMRFEHMLVMRKVLTVEQFKKLHDGKGEWHGKGKDGKRKEHPSK